MSRGAATDMLRRRLRLTPQTHLPPLRAVIFLISPFLGLTPQAKIGIGGRLATPLLPHHRAYGSRTRRFGQSSVS